jgi:hypothetical protein
MTNITEEKFDALVNCVSKLAESVATMQLTQATKGKGKNLVPVTGGNSKQQAFVQRIYSKGKYANVKSIEILGESLTPTGIPRIELKKSRLDKKTGKVVFAEHPVFDYKKETL